MNIALGVGGGIAAYKTAELARALMTRGFTVNVIMTHAAEEFVRPLTFSALTGRKVITNLFSTDTLSSAIEHIQVAQENDILLVAPATADLLAKFANGLADDFLSTTYLAFTGTVVLAPAMNTNMWNHAATQANIRTLRERGHRIVDPDDGALACGMVGPGRLAEPDEIADAVAALTTSKRDLEGETVLITAGPTQEPLDAVRYLTNRSSGKMGYAIAEEAAARGAKVILISGPVSLPAPPNRIHVQTAAQMFDAVMLHLEESTIIIKAAAVADYHRADAPQYKIKKTAARMSLELDPTVDILAELGRKKGDRLLIGFAAETENLIGEARRKLESKNCDMVVANLVSPGIGFDSDENEVVLVTRTADPIPVRRAPKRVVAARILDETMKLRLALHAK
jgi:phosphopantothenoylcysteine decarboxylase/phosphopantothenate--cysteine ligase